MHRLMVALQTMVTDKVITNEDSELFFELLENEPELVQLQLHTELYNAYNLVGIHNQLEDMSNLEVYEARKKAIMDIYNDAAFPLRRIAKDVFWDPEVRGILRMHLADITEAK